MQRTLLGVVALVTLACYGPPIADCVVRCGSGAACPSGTTCEQGYCNGSAGVLCSQGASGGSATHHACVVHDDGSLWCWGDNRDGQLGDGSVETRAVPARVGGDATFLEVDVGGRHTCAIRREGSLWCWGDDASGQVADAAVGGLVYLPVQVGTDLDWQAVSAGRDHTCGIRAGGTLWCWGSEENGRLGDGISSGQKSVPTRVGGDLAYRAVSAGTAATCAVAEAGSLWCWGSNQSGELGDGKGAGSEVPVRVGADEDWIDVSAGDGFACGIRATGQLSCWGRNGDGQLGSGSAEPLVTTPEPITGTAWATVSAGGASACGIRGDRSLWCWGKNDEGRLGDGTTRGSSTPVAVDSGTTWSDVQVGAAHACAVKTDTSEHCWGSNERGQLGGGTTGLRPAPVQSDVEVDWRSVSTGVAHACGIRGTGALYCWGDANHGQLGDGTVEAKVSPQQVGTETDWLDVSAGWQHTCGIRAPGTLHCWGDNGVGQLGDGTSGDRTADKHEPVQIGADADWRVVRAGGGHTCGLRTDGRLMCWGANRLAPVQVGGDTWRDLDCFGLESSHGNVCDGIRADGTFWRWSFAVNSEPAFVARGSEATWTTVASGGGHACAIRADGRLACVGDNRAGQLGDGTFTSSGPDPVPAGTDSDWTQVSAADFHSCGIRAPGTLWCWGEHRQPGERAAEATPSRSTPTRIGDSTSWRSVSASGRYGGFFTCGIRADQTRWCWGSNANGQLGDGNGARTRPALVLYE